MVNSSVLLLPQSIVYITLNIATIKNGISIIGSILYAIIEEIDSATSLKYPLKLKWYLPLLMLSLLE